NRLMIHGMGRDRSGAPRGVLIYDARNPAKPAIIVAARGAIVDLAEGQRLVMKDGTWTQRDPKTGRISALTFREYVAPLAGAITGAIPADAPSEYSTSRLILGPWPAGASHRPLLVELNRRMAEPLAGLAMAVLPLLCLLPGEFNRRGQGGRVLLAAALALALALSDLCLRDLSNWFEAAIPLAYANLIAPTIATTLLLWRDNRHPGARATLLARAAVGVFSCSGIPGDVTQHRWRGPA
ncbi:MAG TPA: LptF/LptG family permease, partial [Xanthobacteraceae bacterium]|nr:LptF/LptG family permease [Xanthobacteraceae bacterium]